MSLIHQTFHTEGIAMLSYLIGDDATGEAAVIDPRPDPEIYLAAARHHGVAITHILETHIHADFMSGSRELAANAPGARIHVSAEGEPDYGFEHQPLRDGERLEIGDVVLTARHTPGHTPEHLSYEAAARDTPDQPWGVFTGDSLFVGSAGRPDLLGSDQARDLARQLHSTLHDYFMKLPDGVLVLPGHGAGSPCGAGIGDRKVSTIGYEKKTNEFLLHDGDEEAFVEFALEAPAAPEYFQRMKKLNLAGPEPTHGLPRVRALPPRAFRQRAEDPRAVNLIDTRSMLAFGGGHVPGALHIEAKPMLSLWAGWMLDPDKDTFLILEDDTYLEEVVRLLLRVGLTRFGGYLAGGMDAWVKAGLPMDDLPQLTVHELSAELDHEAELQLLDVRTAEEFEAGCIDGARHLFVSEVGDRAREILDPSRPVATYCGSGYRASIAASLLQRQGFGEVRNVPGSWQAWQAMHRG
ncbi:rhodanese-like domain-containing protein [Haloferula sp. A504]|uniref:MBL fold metallo-hydrolase n=1 Tax=Haloferula sp. A504 TaxID=3373601 RepID=UPI0031C182D1|nr:MBL fold metallo-hydrolase [Verrucomicrobiaceae bacterium E54]